MREKKKQGQWLRWQHFAFAIIIIGILATIGWVFNIMVLKRILPQLVQMSPVSAVLFILAGISLLNIKAKKINRSLAIFLALVICIVALLKLSVFFTGWDSHIDTILFANSLEGNRMAPNTAFNFLLCGLSLVFLSQRSAKGAVIGQLICLLSFFISILAILGYIYSITSLYVVREFFPMAIHTAFSFILFCMGACLVRGNEGFMQVITVRRLGGILGRRILPVAILLPFFLGWLRFKATMNGYLSEDLSVSLVIVIFMVAYSIGIWMYARSLNKVEADWVEAKKSLVEAKIIAENAKQAQELFLANMSHEIRTPMNGVIGMTSLLNTTVLNADQKAFVDVIRTSGDSLLTIINDILDFSKIQAGKLELEEQPFSIRQAIEETFDLLSSEANKKHLDLLYSIENKIPDYFVGDMTRIRQILVNLVGNGIKFTEKGEILISVKAEEKDDGFYDLNVRIKDTGIGIPEDKLERLFKAFSQADVSTTRKFGGTGLGLAISARLVAMMNGSIGVESVAGKGSVFYFTISAKAALDHVPENFDSHDNLHNKSVLIIDDNSTNLFLLSRYCEELGMLPTCCESGAKALDLCDTNKYDLVITDMMMPEMDGEQTAIAIRESSKNNMPIILMSSAGNTESPLFNGEKLFDAVLIKPLKLRPFFLSLTGVIRKAGPTIVSKSVEEKDTLKELAIEVPLRILVAEDNIINQKIALKMLERFGYESDIAANGLEVIEAMERQKYDMILMDMIMPEMDGLDATKRVRSMPLENQPVIIALTANAMEHERDKCFEAGMDDYLSKPFIVNDLRDIIYKWKDGKNKLV